MYCIFSPYTPGETNIFLSVIFSIWAFYSSFATSSIDTRTEIKVQDAFTRLLEGRTSFVVAHRLSTIRDADCILVMKDGNVIEQGKHTELLEKKGFYYELYNSQFAKVSE